MHNGTVWELPFSAPAVLELQAEFGNLALVPVEAGKPPRLELARSTSDNVEVQVEKVGDVVRVRLEPQPAYKWFSGWESKATVYLPRDVRAAVQTNAGSIHVRGLEGCELGIKANAGKIDLTDVYGLLHVGADAGSITGRGLGGFFDVETHAGSVRLEILDLQPGDHRVRASMGSVRLELARGMDISVETHTTMGSVRNTYPTNPNAPTRLLLATEMGSVRIEEGSMYRPDHRPTGSATESPESADSAEAPAAASEPKPRREDPELERILKMVEAGELSARDADELLRAMGRV